MFSVKKNVLETVALVKAYGIQRVVLSPGSRNAPLIHTFSQDDFFTCDVIVDERAAGFYALGIIQCTREPVVICCTSGSALLNYAPAVAEAYYQQLPLVVVSADRSPEWIDQMDGQTLPQPGIFGSLAKKSVALPEIRNESDRWYCNRLINEALMACTSGCPGPVHINVPISEPLFDYSEEVLPMTRRIRLANPVQSVIRGKFGTRWNELPKRMIIVGQSFKSDITVELLERLIARNDCVILTEHLSNCFSPRFISNFDALLYALPEEERAGFTPDLVITWGGHIVSKRLKQFLRTANPREHWHISLSGEVTDLYRSLTDIIPVEPEFFLKDLLKEITPEQEKPFYEKWRKSADKLVEPSTEETFSDLVVTGRLLECLPQHAFLHLGNSSPVRNAQLYVLNPSVTVFCNRGVNGIEGTLASTIGFASATSESVYLLIGDLSFFYGLNSLWNIEHIRNLRILLINNGGGGIFHLLPGLNKTDSLKHYVAASHTGKAEGWAEAGGLYYLSAENKEELDEKLELFTDQRIKRSIVLEVFTDPEINKKEFVDYYRRLKQLF